MPRSKGNTLTVMEDTSMERLAARGISKVAPLLSPWLVGMLMFTAAAVFHRMWDSPAAAPWAAVGLTTGTLVLTGLTYLVSHERRGVIGRTHNTLTTFLTGLWITVATITGPTAEVTKSLAVLGGTVLALSWNIRHVIRDQHFDTGNDRLAFLFDRSKDTFGLDGARVHTRKAGQHKIEGTLALPPGEKSVEDVQKKTEYLEGGMKLPPGSISLAANEDRADHARITVSDPRVMKRPIGWPGPSRPGASIAEPIRLGVWQDLDPVAYLIIGHHLQMMGQTGTGKSIGGAWNYLAETVTRIDVATFAADLTKGEQTLGPLRPALHRFETTKAGVRAMLADLHAQVKPRTDFLSAHGHQNWAPGCGLTYWVVWLEEFPDIGDAVDMDAFLRFLKACRSAGVTVVMSLQRSDWTQMPTLARGQLAKMCFGVADADDADFGLSDPQQKRGARPELWQNKQPGMAYLDAPSIPDERIALPLRTYAWGATDEQANAAMRAHAAAWPATDKAVDQFTAAVMTPGGAGGAVVLAAVPNPGTDQDDQDDQDDDLEEDGDVVSEYLRTEDPNPGNQAGPDDAIDDSGYDDFTFEMAQPGAEKLTPEQARRALLGQIARWADQGRAHFATRDLAPTWIGAGMTRQWAQNHIRRLVADGVLDRDDDNARYVILRRPDLPEEAA
jgi:hypothetical protein